MARGLGGGWDRRKDDPAARWNKAGRAPAKKDRRRWCRGKVGVEHVTELVEDGYLGRTCRAGNVGKWVTYETHREWVIVGTRWWCVHMEQCVNCGKKLRRLEADECPARVEVG